MREDGFFFFSIFFFFRFVFFFFHFFFLSKSFFSILVSLSSAHLFLSLSFFPLFSLSLKKQLKKKTKIKGLDLQDRRRRPRQGPLPRGHPGLARGHLRVGCPRGALGRTRLRKGRPFCSVGHSLRDRHGRGPSQPPAPRDQVPRGVPGRGPRRDRAVPAAGPAAEADREGGLRRFVRDAADGDPPPHGGQHGDVPCDVLAGERGIPGHWRRERRRRRRRVWVVGRCRRRRQHRRRWRKRKREPERERPRRFRRRCRCRSFLVFRRRWRCPAGGAFERERRGSHRRCYGKRRRRRKLSSGSADAFLFFFFSSCSCCCRCSYPCPGAAPNPCAPSSLCR